MSNEACAILHGKQILVVEDNIADAVEYRFELRAVGAVDSLQPSVRRALGYLADHDVDAAILDCHLPDGNCGPVLEQLTSRHIPFIVVSGDTFSMRDIPTSAPVLSKPVQIADVCRKLADALSARAASDYAALE